MKKYLALMALALSSQAYAATYYFSDCGTGAVSGCVPGDDTSATPTNPATPLRTMNEAYRRFRIAAAGDTILFAKGGVFTAVGENDIQNLNSSAATPITFDSYQPSWYSGSNKPIIRQQDGASSIFEFDDTGAAEADGGYVVRNLSLQGEGNTGSAIFTSQATRDIILDNLTIDGFQLGVYCGENIQNVELKNSALTNIKGAGVLWGCGGSSKIVNNTFDNTGFGHWYRDHAMYLTLGASGTISGNTLTNTAHYQGWDGDPEDPYSTYYDGTRCVAVPIVGHGQISNLVIENNKIIEQTQSGGGCWGIAIDGGYGFSDPEGFHNVTIRGNKLVNVGNMGIGCSSCDNFTIENNVLVWEFPEDVIAISVPDRVETDDDPTTNVYIRNNSIFIKEGGSGSIAIRTAETGNFVVSSNVIYFTASTHSNAQCFDTTNRTLANFTNFSNNLCFRANGGVRFSQDYATLAAAQTADYRWNTDGQIVNPKLVTTPQAVNGYVMHLKADSPGIDAGNPTYCSPLAFGGITRSTIDGACDIGAYEKQLP